MRKLYRVIVIFYFVNLIVVTGKAWFCTLHTLPDKKC